MKIRNEHLFNGILPDETEEKIISILDKADKWESLSQYSYSIATCLIDDNGSHHYCIPRHILPCLHCGKKKTVDTIRSL